MTYREMLRQVNSNTEDWIARLGIDMTIPDYDITWSNKVYMKAPIRRYDQLMKITMTTMLLHAIVAIITADIHNGTVVSVGNPPFEVSIAFICK